MRRLLMIVVSTILLVTGSAAQAIGAPLKPPPPVPDDQPLPGQVIGNRPLAPVDVGGSPSRVMQGVTGHAAYNIEIPPTWNGQLVMWAHGFRGATNVLTADAPAFQLRQRLLNQGYAWAASSYYANNYDVQAGVLSTRHLSDFFARQVAKPSKTFIAGVSMGGHITARSIEEYPGYYDAALPMCGVLGDHGLFDYFLDFQLVSQDLADVPAYPIPTDYQTSAVPKIQSTLGLTDLRPGGPDTTNDLGKQFRAITVNRSGGTRPGDSVAFAYWHDFLFGLADSDSGGTLAQEPGRVATNVRTSYVPNTPVDVNRTVQRVRPADAGSRNTNRLTQVPSISGRPTVPVLSLHTLGDLFVPFSMEQQYHSDVARQGRTNLLVQRAIRAVEHCEFSPNEAATAWDDLVRWERDGTRPQGDDVTRPSTVAEPTYGCRFTDPSAHSTGTRPFYPACP